MLSGRGWGPRVDVSPTNFSESAFTGKGKEEGNRRGGVNPAGPRGWDLEAAPTTPCKIPRAEVTAGNAQNRQLERVSGEHCPVGSGSVDEGLLDHRGAVWHVAEHMGLSSPAHLGPDPALMGIPSTVGLNCPHP